MLQISIMPILLSQSQQTQEGFVQGLRFGKTGGRHGGESSEIGKIAT